MGEIINTFFSQTTDRSADQTLGYSAMASAAAGASAYLAATLQCTTPELRSILSGFVSQKIMEHEAVTNLLINKGWMNPYDEPVKQLETSYRDANSVLSQH
jgi:spore coat protein CotF